MNVKFKPLLAYTIEDTAVLDYAAGLLASVKLDGIRVVILDSVVYSRSMKPIRSKAVQALFGKPEYNGLDAEVLYGDWNASNVFNLTTQAVMATELKSEFKAEEIRLAVFDYVLSEAPYTERIKIAMDIVSSSTGQVALLPQSSVFDEKSLLLFEASALANGYEGIMVRAGKGAYKQGRSTAKEGTIGKLKRFTQKEATVVGFEEKMHNANEAKTNELGRTQRSQAKDGMVATGTLGALVAECEGIRFTCGSGFDDVTRQEVWDNRDSYLGKLFTFKYFEIGMKDSYRFPIWLGFRDPDDMSE